MACGGCGQGEVIVRRISDERRAEIVRLYYEGLDLIRIAERVGVSDSFVSKLLISSDLRDPRRLVDERTTADICRMYERGTTVRGLAERYGLHVSTIHAVLGRQGVPRKVVPLDESETETILALWKEEPNIYHIAKRVNRSRGTVLKIVRQHGLWYPRAARPRRRNPKHIWKRTMAIGKR